MQAFPRHQSPPRSGDVTLVLAASLQSSRRHFLRRCVAKALHTFVVYCFFRTVAEATHCFLLFFAQGCGPRLLSPKSLDGVSGAYLLVRGLIESCEEGDIGAVVNLLRGLSKLALGDDDEHLDEAASALVEAGAVPALSQVLDVAKVVMDEEALTLGLEALTALAMSEPGGEAIAADFTLLGRVASALESTSGEARREAMGCLACCSHREIGARSLVASGAVGAACEAVGLYPFEGPMVDEALVLARSLLDHGLGKPQSSPYFATACAYIFVASLLCSKPNAARWCGQLTTTLRGRPRWKIPWLWPWRSSFAPGPKMVPQSPQQMPLLLGAAAAASRSANQAG